MAKNTSGEIVETDRVLFNRNEIGRVTIANIEAGIDSALERGTIGFYAVKHLVLCRIERRPPRLDVSVYPYLPKAHVAARSAGD